MNDIRLAAGPGVPRGLVVPSDAITERFSRSSGPGGQGVNTTDSRVQLSVEVSEMPLTSAQRERLLAQLRPRLIGTVLTVDVSTHRSQSRNRREARERVSKLLRDGLAPPPPARRATRPTRGSVTRRLAGKRRRSAIKQDRRPVDPNV